MTQFIIKLLLVFVAIGFLAAFIIPMIIPKPPSELQARIDYLSLQNDSLNSYVSQKDSVFAAIEVQIDSLKSQSGKNETKIIYIKSNRDNAVNTIDSLSDNQLFDFFAGLKTED